MRTSILITFILLFSNLVTAQTIFLEHKTKPEKSKHIRLDKQVMVRTFEGDKVKGLVSLVDEKQIIIEDKSILYGDIMTISGYLTPGSKKRALGLGLTIGAGVVLPLAVYYIFGGIAYAMPNGIFVGAVILAVDLLLAYAGTSLMGIYPRRFSTMNWSVLPAPDPVDQPTTLPLPIPSG